jgi:hypothetical protein
VSVFLTETPTRHSILYKHKHVRDKRQTKLKSNSSKLTGVSGEQSIDVDDEEPSGVPTVLRREDSEGDIILLDDIPTIGETELERHTKSRRAEMHIRNQVDDDGKDEISDENVGNEDFEVIEDDESASADRQGSDISDTLPTGPPPRNRRSEAAAGGEGAMDHAGLDENSSDDKKKMALDVSYEGFAIYGRVLCLVVKRRVDGSSGRSSNTSQPSQVGGQAMMENWITSTQIPLAAVAEDLGSS